MRPSVRLLQKFVKVANYVNSQDDGEMTDTGAQPPRDEEAVANFVEHFAQLLVEGGMARMPARVFARLLVTDDGRLTAAELGERLHASPAAISGAIRYLEQVDLALRRRERGSRRDYYQVRDLDLWYQVMTRRDRLLERWIDGLVEGIDALGPDTPAGLRVRETREFMQFMAKELPEMLERWRVHRAAVYGPGGPPAPAPTATTDPAVEDGEATAAAGAATP
jgi:DNA-binding transcriptional regulator GbsR (MarR family)